MGIAVVAAFLATSAVTGVVRTLALRWRVIDLPTDRSSHVQPTPTGGGLAIIVGTAIGLCCATLMASVSATRYWEILLAGMIVGVVGLVDDVHHLSPAKRLLGHFLAAGLAIHGLDIVSVAVSAGVSTFLVFAVYAAAIVYAVWLVNLTNFMDGIDGLASIEVITSMLGGVILFQPWKTASPQVLMPLVLSAAVGGFLLWNWAPSKIFMGDVGSGFLGFMLALMSLEAASTRPILFASWLILVAVFVTDATVTLLVRAFRGDSVVTAHRQHAYQHLAARLKSHGCVSLGVGMVNVVWLTPIAVLVSRGQIGLVLGLLAAYVPLVLVCLGMGSGQVRAGALLQARSAARDQSD